MKTRISTGFTVAVLLLVLTGCTAKEKRQAASHNVTIQAVKFQPQVLTVQKGDTVVWTNQDIVAHNVTQQPGAAWASSTLQPGQSWRHVVDETADYICTLHPVMKGNIEVE